MKHKTSGGGSGGGSTRPKNRWFFRGGDHSSNQNNSNHMNAITNRRKEGTGNGSVSSIVDRNTIISPKTGRSSITKMSTASSSSSSPRRFATSPEGSKSAMENSNGSSQRKSIGVIEESARGRGSAAHIKMASSSQSSPPTSASIAPAGMSSVGSFANHMNNMLHPNLTSTNVSSPSASSSSASPTHHPNPNSLTPVGLSGPTSFIFSPPPVGENEKYQIKTGGVEVQQHLHSKKRNQRQRYVSFLSSHPSVSGQNLTATGSPVRTIGGSIGGTNHGEKRLCVMDLEQIWNDVDFRDDCQRGREYDHEMEGDDEQEEEEKGDGKMGVHVHVPTSVNDECENEQKHEQRSHMLLNTDAVMEKCVTPLLNTSLPFNRKQALHQCFRSQDIENRQGSQDSDAPHSTCPCPFSPTGGGYRYGNKVHDIGSPLEDVSDASLSLEEKLRRERQRVHSNGITQFAWERCSYSDSYSHYPDVTTSAITSPRSKGISMRRGRQNKFGSPLSSAKRPIPERIPDALEVEEMRDANGNIPEEGGNARQQHSVGGGIRIIIPLRGNIYMQDGVGPSATCPLVQLYDKSMLEEDDDEDRGRGGQSSKASSWVGRISNSRRTKLKKKKRTRTSGSAVGRDTGAIDPQLSPDGSMVAFVVGGEIYAMSVDNALSCNCLGVDSDMYDEKDKEDEKEGGNDCQRMDVENHSTDDKGEASTTSKSWSEVRRPTRLTYGARVHDSSDEDDDEGDEDWMSEDSSQEDNDSINSGSKRKRRYGKSITHGLADFVAQEEMDRYQGFWWDEKSQGIIFVRVDESCVPPYRITHHGSDGRPWEESTYEEHRYPFAGEHNPEISLGYIKVDRSVMLGPSSAQECESVAKSSWSNALWFDGPENASEYLARVNWLPDGSACVQWQDRRQSKLLLVKIDVETGESVVLHQEQSDVWINLHHMFRALPRAIHPCECLQDTKVQDCPQLPDRSFSYIFASERAGFCHMYLYTYIPGDVSATLLRVISAGSWIVENIVGVDMESDLVYFTGTFKSPLEKHLYCLPLRNASKWKNSISSSEENDSNGMRLSLRQVMNTISGGSSHSRHSRDSNRSSGSSRCTSYNYPQPVSTSQPPNPLRLTSESGMHSVAMDSTCRIFVDTCSDLNRPTTTKIYSIPIGGPEPCDMQLANNLRLHCVLYDVSKNYDPSLTPSPPELLSFPTSDGTETLYAALYSPDPKVHGPGPYPLICNVYGGPHVQRVTRSWCQCADMRIQRLCALGFAVVKCDNRGSARRGLAFEGAIRKHLGRVEVLDQVTAVRHLVMKRIADPHRVGISGWSYGGYLAAMCLCRAPDVFRVAIAGAPVTSWDGYDTHYTERYMGLPQENVHGYDEAAVFEHVPNMRGKLLIIHGLIDENVHFRHSARLINRLTAAGKDYEFLAFPDERHSPRKLRDRIYMEKRMSKFFADNLLNASRPKMMGNL